VAEQLARFAEVPARDVGYAGLKDRNAITVQHFTLPLGHRPEPDWSELTAQDFRVLATARHGRKLKVGALKGNRFRLVLRHLSQPASSLITRLEVIRRKGVPNYFGPQRFGHAGGNVVKASDMLMGKWRVHDRKLRGLMLSSARSLIFNAVLAARVEQGSWDNLLPGEVLMLDGSHSIFRATAADETLKARVAAADVHPTGPLWGRGEPIAADRVRELEEEVAAGYKDLADGLMKAGLEASRRALRLPVRDLFWEYPDETTLILDFFLPAGAYATAVLRELIQDDPAGEGDVNEA